MNEQDPNRRTDKPGEPKTTPPAEDRVVCGIATPHFDFTPYGVGTPSEATDGTETVASDAPNGGSEGFDPNPYGDSTPTEAVDGTEAEASDAPNGGSEGFNPNPYGDPNAPAPTFGGSEADEEDPERRRRLSIASLVCSILSYFLGLTCCIGFPLAIASIVISLMERSRYGKMSGMSLTGFILSIVNLLLFIGIILFYVLMTALAFILSGEGA